jgi:hypothetical protein
MNAKKKTEIPWYLLVSVIPINPKWSLAWVKHHNLDEQYKSRVDQINEQQTTIQANKDRKCDCCGRVCFSICGNYTMLLIDFVWWSIKQLIHLASVAASLSETGLSSSRLAQMNIAVSTHDNSLSMAKDGRDLEASRAFNIHEKRVGALYKSLQLVCAGFELRRGV